MIYIYIYSPKQTHFFSWQEFEKSSECHLIENERDFIHRKSQKGPKNCICSIRFYKHDS